jgi:hypothetical protein
MTTEKLNKETVKLIKVLESAIIIKKGDLSVNEDGEKYRYDFYDNKYKNTPYWLALIFSKAAKAAGKEYSNQFYDGLYSFHFDRSPYKGRPDGKITFSKLVIVNTN